MSHLPTWLAIVRSLPRKRRDQIAVRFAVKHARPENRHCLEDSVGSAPVSVAELLEHAVREGRGVRLHWTEADTDPHGLAIPPDDDWPTVVLPRELIQRGERGHRELE